MKLNWLFNIILKYHRYIYIYFLLLLPCFWDNDGEIDFGESDGLKNKSKINVLVGTRLDPMIFLCKIFLFLGEISLTFSSESVEYIDIFGTISIYLKSTREASWEHYYS